MTEPSKPSRANGTPDPQAPPPPAKPVRVLLIDDDEGDRLIMRRALEKMRGAMHLDEMDRSPSDFPQLARQDYDVILLDHILPGSDAFQFLARAKDAGLKTPVVVVTGYEEEILDIELMEAGAAAYLSKDRLTPNSLWRTLLYASRISRAEDALRRSEEMFKTQYKNLPVATVTWRRVADEFTLIDFNDAATRLTHGVIDAYRGRKASEVHGDLPDILEDLRRCAADKSVSTREVEYTYRTTGEIRHLRAGFAFAPPDLVITHLDDITERKQAELALAASEEKYRAVVEGSEQAIFIVDGRGTYLFLNRAGAKDLGMEASDVVGRTLGEIFPKKMADMHMEYVRQVLRSGQGIIEDSATVIRGVPRWYNMSLQPLRDAQGKCTAVVGIAADITARKAAEQKQEAMTAGLRAVVHIADELISCEDVDQIYRRTVELAREKLGIERCSIFVRDGNVVRGTYGTDMQGRTTDEHSCALPDWSTWEEQFVPPHNGDPRWVLRDKPLVNWSGQGLVPAGTGWNACTPISQARHAATALFFNDAAITRAPFDPVKQEVISILCSTLADIIERKKAESALKQSEERFREMAELLPETVFELDAEGNLTFVNRTALEMFGYSRTDYERGLNAFDMFEAEDHERMRRNMQAIMAGEDIPGQEYHARRKDGRTFPVIAYATRIMRDGKAVGLRGFVIDVTSQKAMENALRDSEANFKALAENAIDGILILGENGRHVYANARATEITGYTADELKHMGLADMAHPDEAPRLLAQARSRLAGGEAPNRYDTVILTKDGRSLPIEVAATQTVWQGRPAAMAIIRDISVQRQIEEERRSLTARLLEVQEDERKEISAVLHDHLGQLLTLASLELGEVPRKDKKSAARMQAAKLRIDEALAAVRDMAISLRPPLLDDLGLETALEALAEEFTARSDLEIVFEKDGDIPAQDSSVKTCLYRVLQEALTNVAKHARATRADVALRVDEGQIVLEVADDGIGLAEPDDSGQKGIGLIGMRERLGRCGGSLELNAEQGHGTRLIARVPLGWRAAKEAP